jgi:DNA-binding MarR family transcriptional regulator
MIQQKRLDEIKWLYNSGLTISEIGRKLNVSKQAISRTMRISGLKCRPRNISISDDELVAAVSGGRSGSAIARDVGVTPAAINRRIRHLSEKGLIARQGSRLPNESHLESGL